MENEILEFIQRRFKDDSNWNNGNCYYFTVILKERFPEGRIYYDVSWGHFVFKYMDIYYDHEGIYTYDEEEYLIPWCRFKKYDSYQYERIVRDCII